MAWGWKLVIVYALLSLPVWYLLRPPRVEPHERARPWLTPRPKARRQIVNGVLNLLWGLGGITLLVLALAGVTT